MPARVSLMADAVPGRWSAKRRLAIGLSPLPGPGLVLVLFGLALGPHGLGLLTAPVLASLDPAVSVALAALGVFVGLDITVHRPHADRLVGASIVLVVATMLIVGGGVLLVSLLSPLSEAVLWLLPVVLGICAVPSSTVVDASGDARSALGGRSGGLGDVLPIVLAMLALAWARQASPTAAAMIVAQTALIALTIATAAWLLVMQTVSDSEQRVFVIGALLLLGGVAAHLSLSALFTGLLAGLFWKAIGPHTAEAIVRGVQYLQHPLIVLLLVVAGARLTFSFEWAGLVLAYVVFRIGGKLIGGWLVATTVMRELSLDVGFTTISPGIVGIAIALNVLQAHDTLEVASTVFAIVVLGSIGSELFSLANWRRSST